MRQSRAIMRGVNLRTNFNQLLPASFASRRAYLVEAFKEGVFLAEPDMRGKPRPNPMTDPAMMEGMMGMMKGNVAMMVPQSLIMGWINAFFSGYVISESISASSRAFESNCLLPMCSETAFPSHSTIQEHAPIWCRYQRSGRQVGVQPVMVLFDPIRSATRLQLYSWQQQRYVHCVLYLGASLTNNATAASQVSQQMAQAQAGGMPGMGPEQDPDKLFQNEAENLEVLEHKCILEDIENRLLASFS